MDNPFKPAFGALSMFELRLTQAFVFMKKSSN